MSGGYYNYYNFQEIIDCIEENIQNNDIEPIPQEYFTPNNFKDETIKEFKKGVEYLKIAYIYAKRIDYLLSHDDGEETFHTRLSEDLTENGIKL